jgi:arylsulfatase
VGYEKRWAHASNTPFTHYKSYIHEGGIASPLIIHWPEQIKTPAVKNEVTHIMDIMPTCLDIARVTYPASYHNTALKPLDGLSLLPLLTGKSWQGHDILIWEHFGNKGIRQGKWKLVAEKDQPWELYDMKADRTENHNLATANPQKVKELEELYRKKAEQAGVIVSQ